VPKRCRTISVVDESSQVIRTNGLVFTTTRILARSEGGNESVGTGFFCSFALADGRSSDVIVTNKHVIFGATSGEFQIHWQGDGGGPGGTKTLRFASGFQQNWVGHPDPAVDLCAFPLQARVGDRDTSKLFYLPFDQGAIPTADELKDVRVAEEVFMVGYPVGLWDEVWSMPIVRRGTLASYPALPFNGKPWGVVDIAAFPGSSGSPIVLLNEGSFVRGGELVLGSRLHLLGVLFGGPQFDAEGRLEIVDVPTATAARIQTRIPLHLGYFVRAGELLPLRDEMSNVGAI
jgi:hypothetical protein